MSYLLRNESTIRRIKFCICYTEILRQPTRSGVAYIRKSFRNADDKPVKRFALINTHFHLLKIRIKNAGMRIVIRIPESPASGKIPSVHESCAALSLPLLERKSFQHLSHDSLADITCPKFFEERG